MSSPDPVVIPPPPPPPPSGRPALKPVAIPLPRIWLGYMVASICLLADVGGWIGGAEVQSGFLMVSLPLSLIGWIYWLFCIHRLHLILWRATGAAYPVRARRAVGFQLIPFYAWAWRFRWSNQIARFVNLHSPVPMKTDWPGVFLLLGSLLGTVALLVAWTSLRLFVLFSVMLYLTRKIKKVVTFTDALHVARRKQLDMALTAGLGAALGFLLVRALVEFSTKTPREQLQDGLGILLLSFALARFIEPLVGKVRVAAGMETAHPSHREQRPWLVRTAVFLALVFSNFFHDLLHSQIDRHFGESWQTLVVGLLVSGGITYFWISGIRQEPRKAARFGALSGVGIALLAAFILGIALDSSEQAAKPNTASVLLPDVGLPHPVRLPAVPFGDIKSAGTRAWPWALLGLVGGLAIDRKWGGQCVRTVALGMLGAALLFGVAWLFWAHTGSYRDEIMKIVADVGSVGGWCLGLLLHPATAAIFGSR